MTGHEERSYRLDAFPAAAIRFSRALDRNRERIAEEEGLSASELRALFYIGEHVSVTPKQLAEHMHVTTAAVTFISRRLVERDLLHRVDHPGDRRSIFLELTPRAHAAMERIHSDFATMVSRATAHLDHRQVEEFTDYLGSVATAIAEHTALIAGARSAATL
ncbi:MarR family winged helix-turn-helix transcriptional regulator [uncultured Microbacterium sp.]|uniref:MarR family winged helix-turn-helix transcriptional regulator n=1 Tax=uncultured Microbacterium sp. TaxID=191216 RepID=UPI0035CB3E8F